MYFYSYIIKAFYVVKLIKIQKFLPSYFDYFSGDVTCGGHDASSCSECPQGNGAAWCNGECEWNGSTETCGKTK